MKVKGIRFKPCMLGNKELCFAWREFSDFLRVNLTAGSPAKLEVVDWPDVEKVCGTGPLCPELAGAQEQS